MKKINIFLLLIFIFLSIFSKYSFANEFSINNFDLRYYKYQDSFQSKVNTIAIYFSPILKFSENFSSGLSLGIVPLIDNNNQIFYALDSIFSVAGFYNSFGIGFDYGQEVWLKETNLDYLMSDKVEETYLLRTVSFLYQFSNKSSLSSISLNVGEIQIENNLTYRFGVGFQFSI